MEQRLAVPLEVERPDRDSRVREVTDDLLEHRDGKVPGRGEPSLVEPHAAGAVERATEGRLNLEDFDHAVIGVIRGMRRARPQDRALPADIEG